MTLDELNGTVKLGTFIVGRYNHGSGQFERLPYDDAKDRELDRIYVGDDGLLIVEVL